MFEASLTCFIIFFRERETELINENPETKINESSQGYEMSAAGEP